MTRAALALACALLGACAAPPERFHTLLPNDPAPPMAAVAARPLYVEILPVAVAPQMNHPQWVVRAADGSLSLLERERWAAPLADELRGALSERLATRWGATDLRAVPHPVAAAWRVQVDVLRFESLPAREARIDSMWSLSPTAGAGPALVCRSAIRESVAQAGAPALAAAHRRAVARLADEIGQQLTLLRMDARAGCPPTVQ